MPWKRRNGVISTKRSSCHCRQGALIVLMFIATSFITGGIILALLSSDIFKSDGGMKTIRDDDVRMKVIKNSLQ
jgi:hypothetical protein